MPRKKAQLDPIHPGVTLSEDFLHPRSLNALRLARYFNTSPQFWLNLQANYDRELALNP